MLCGSRGIVGRKPDTTIKVELIIKQQTELEEIYCIDAKSLML